MTWAPKDTDAHVAYPERGASAGADPSGTVIAIFLYSIVRKRLTRCFALDHTLD